MTVQEFIDEFMGTEGHDCTDYKIVVDMGLSVWDKDTDRLYMVYNHLNKIAYIKRQRIIENP